MIVDCILVVGDWVRFAFFRRRDGGGGANWVRFAQIARSWWFAVRRLGSFRKFAGWDWVRFAFLVGGIGFVSRN